jgi:hypothetical protein
MPEHTRSRSGDNDTSAGQAHSLKHTILSHLWGILWGLLIVFLTSLPGDLIPDVPSFFDLFEPDKLIHVLLFAVFVCLLLLGSAKQKENAFSRRHALLLVLNAGILLGALTELMQKYWIPGRVASVYDFIANTVGCFVGWGVFVWWMKRGVNNE